MNLTDDKALYYVAIDMLTARKTISDFFARGALRVVVAPPRTFGLVDVTITYPHVVSVIVFSGELWEAMTGEYTGPFPDA